MRKTVNNNKRPTRPKISYIAKNEEEKQHLLSLESLLDNKRRGDWKLVGEMLGIPTASAEKAFFRVYQKNHFEVVKALKKIIEKRKELLNN